MFNQVDITLGEWLIMQSDNIYVYRAYTESILNYSCDALDTQHSAGLFHKDTYGNFEARALNGDNEGFVERASFAAGSRQFELLGHLHSDLFYQNKLLVNGINLNVKLTRNKDSFCLINGDAEQYKLVILSASLFVNRVKVSQSVRLAHAEALQLLNANYAVERVALKICSIPTGTRLTQQQNLFPGQLPKLIIIECVDNSAFSGLYTSKPFNFKHYDINYAVLVHEGAVIPSNPCTLSFGTGNFIREYLGLVSTTGKHMRDPGVVVSREGYGAGYTLFAFNLTPIMEDGDHCNLLKNGNLKSEIPFSQPLATNMNMIVFSVFNGVIQINHTCQIMFDYL
ncbi:uncharacterized protein F54H12.2-like [Pleurodeles waltl]|uniref:uncharacterized protein F54H12.2-like n=1 Tax=Pleurodeles waltl TaxID=8319 RepID=UPI0037097007